MLISVIIRLKDVFVFKSYRTKTTDSASRLWVDSNLLLP